MVQIWVIFSEIILQHWDREFLRFVSHLVCRIYFRCCVAVLSLFCSSNYQYMTNKVMLQNWYILVTVNLQSKERSAKSLTADTFKETGSTFRGISVICVVIYWALNEPVETWENIISKKISQSPQEHYYMSCVRLCNAFWCSTYS